MNRYIQITIETRDENESDMLVARLSYAGFEGFEEEPNKLHAFIPETLYDISKIEKIIADIKTSQFIKSFFNVILCEAQPSIS